MGALDNIAASRIADLVPSSSAALEQTPTQPHAERRSGRDRPQQVPGPPAVAEPAGDGPDEHERGRAARHGGAGGERGGDRVRRADGPVKAPPAVCSGRAYLKGC